MKIRFYENNQVSLLSDVSKEFQQKYFLPLLEICKNFEFNKSFDSNFRDLSHLLLNIYIQSNFKKTFLRSYYSAKKLNTFF